MKISFDAIAESAIENFKGGEGTFHVHMFQDMNNKIMKGRLVLVHRSEHIRMRQQ